MQNTFKTHGALFAALIMLALSGCSENAESTDAQTKAGEKPAASKTAETATGEQTGETATGETAKGNTPSQPKTDPIEISARTTPKKPENKTSDEESAATGAESKTAAADTPPAQAPEKPATAKPAATQQKPASQSDTATQTASAGTTASSTTAATDNNQQARQKASAGGPSAGAKLARDTINKLLTELEDREAELRTRPQALNKLVERVMIPIVDVDHMAQQVLGQHWKTASEAQRKRFTGLFQRMVVETYGNALYGFKREQIEYKAVDAPADAEAFTFEASVNTDRGETVPVNLNMHTTQGEWKVHDARVGTLSLIDSYRGQFRSQLDRGSIDQLLQKLEQRYGG